MSSETIKVGVRLRPLDIDSKGQEPALAIKESDVHVIPGVLNNSDSFIKEPQGVWRFDHAMDSSDLSNPEHVNNYGVYDTFGRGIVEHALEGFNACLFCYGQTGTGKTATIFGDKTAGPGFLTLLLKDLFQHKATEESQGNSVNIAVQMLEIYNENVFDLLSETQSKIELHVLPVSVQVKGAELKPVASVEDCLLLIDQGNSRKHMAATAVNPSSSRGHSIIKVVVERFQNDEGIHLNSEIYLADLAGHENEKTTKVTGEQLIELSFINKSLMWLESALHALATRHAHARHIVRHMHDMALFRNSKLTLLLSNALLGNSLAHVIVTLSPAADQFNTSLNSLRFANEVKRILVDVQPSAYVDPSVQIRKLENEVKQLKEQLSTSTVAPVAELQAEVKQLKEQLAKATSAPPAANSNSDAQSKAASGGSRARVTRPNPDPDPSDATAVAESTAKEEEDVLEPWSDWIRTLRQKMLPEVVVEKLRDYKSENENLRRQLEAVVGTKVRGNITVHGRFRKGDKKERLPSPVPPSKISMDSSQCGSASTAMVTGSASTGYASTYGTGSASTYGTGSPSPKASLRSVSPQMVTQMQRSPYPTVPSTAALGAWTAASPVVEDTTYLSPVRMCSALSAQSNVASSVFLEADRAPTPIRMQSAQSTGSPMRMRSSMSAQNLDIGASAPVVMLRQPVPGVASPSYGGRAIRI